MALYGNFEGINEFGVLTGWAYDDAGTGRKISVDVFIDGIYVSELVADQYRPDLAEAGFDDAACAFLCPFPERYWDGENHAVEVRIAGTALQIGGSPATVSLAATRRPNAGMRTNFVGNAKFNDWPNGVWMSLNHGTKETAKYWTFDSKKGKAIDAVVKLDHGPGMSLRDDEYALSIRINERDPQGYARLVCALDPGAAAYRSLFLSIGIAYRNPQEPASLRVGEMFLGVIRDGVLENARTIRKNLPGIGVNRLRNISVTLSDAIRDLTRKGAGLAICLDLKGTGELAIFSPELAEFPKGMAYEPAASGAFEDTRIQGQLSSLALSEIWTAGVIARPPPGEAVASVGSHSLANRSIISQVPFIQIVVPVFNAVPDVADLISSVRRQTSSPWEIIIVDDGSSEASRRQIQNMSAADPRIRYIGGEENAGYTRAVNLGLQSSVSDLVVLMNSDVIVGSEWLTKLFDAINGDRAIAAVGPVSNAASWQTVPSVKLPSGQWRVCEIPTGYTVDSYSDLVAQCAHGATTPFPLLNGFCTLFRRAALEQVGYFDDERFPEGYGEENDLFLRLSLAGFTSMVAASCYVYHKKSRSFGNERRAALTKKSNKVLRCKHPMVDFAKIESEMRENYVLKDLRRELILRTRSEPRADADLSGSDVVSQVEEIATPKFNVVVRRGRRAPAKAPNVQGRGS